MYEDDTPPAERRAQALSLDRDLLRELLGQEELRDLLDADAVDEVERQLRGDPTTPDQLHDKLRLRGDLRAGEYDAGARGAAARRAARGDRAHRRRGAADRRRGRGPLPRRARRDAAVRAARRVPRGRPGLAAAARAALREGPRAVHHRARRTSASAATSAAILVELERDELLVRGELRPGRHRARVVRPRRAAPAAARVARGAAARGRAGRAGGARAVPARRGTAIDRRASLREALVPLQALALPVALWESEVLPRRVPGYRPEHLDALTRERRGRLGRRRARPRRALLPRGRGGARPGAGAPRARGRGARRDPRRARRGALFWVELLDETGLDDDDGAARALGSRLGGRGDERRVDAAARGAAVRRAEAGAPAAPLLAPPRRRARRRPQGRWSRDRAAVRRRARPPRARRAAARAAGHRHARRRSRRGHPRRLRRGLRRAARARDARALPPRLLRRGPRRRAVRARRRGRAAARAARRAGGRATRSCSRPPTRRSRTAPRCRGRSAPARVRRASRARTSSRSAARRCSTSSAAAARSCRCAIPDEAWLRPALAALVAHVRAGGVKRLAVERFDGEPVVETRGDAAARRGGLPRRAAARGPTGVARRRPRPPARARAQRDVACPPRG